MLNKVLLNTKTMLMTAWMKGVLRRKYICSLGLQWALLMWARNLFKPRLTVLRLSYNIIASNLD